MSDPEMSPSRSLTARGAATRARIVEAAANLIYEHGVDRTSLDEVLAASGASKSQLYHYFADKDALVLAVIALQTERVLGAQQPYLGSLDTLTALRAWRDTIVRATVAANYLGCPLGSLASELANESVPARERLASGFTIWLTQIEAGLRAMAQRGDLRAEADPHELALALLAAAQGGFLVAKTMRSTQPLEVTIDVVIGQIASMVIAQV